MQTSLRLLARGAVLLATAAALQAASPWSVRVRATYLETVDHSDAFSALGVNFGENAVRVNDQLIPEIDVDYAFTDHWAAELVLTIPRTQDVSLAGVGGLGSFKHLPPTMLGEYKFNPGGKVQPYVGAGVNFTLIWDDNLSVAGVPLSLDNYSLGVAAQAGVDVKIDEQWSINVDLKWAAIRSDVKAGTATLTQARLDPLLYAVGATYRF